MENLLFDLVPLEEGAKFLAYFDPDEGAGAPSVCPILMTDNEERRVSDILRFIIFEEQLDRAYYADHAIMDFGNNLLRAAGSPFQIHRVALLDEDNETIVELSQDRNIRLHLDAFDEFRAIRYKIVKA